MLHVRIHLEKCVQSFDNQDPQIHRTAVRMPCNTKRKIQTNSFIKNNNSCKSIVPTAKTRSTPTIVYISILWIYKIRRRSRTTPMHKHTQTPNSNRLDANFWFSRTRKGHHFPVNYLMRISKMKLMRVCHNPSSKFLTSPDASA
mmetsp:Transcript_24668/g.36784  ORF Transcript_24668/g.36784 Transcript_24668/m.36784 type:complete len:144 (-) Transcript_24668:2-433(-)